MAHLRSSRLNDSTPSSHLLDCSEEEQPLSTESPDAARREPTAASTTADPTGELLVPLVASDTGPARAWAEATLVDRVAPPDELDEGATHLNVTRTFCFAAEARK